jgi:hypothetical protein
VHEALGSTVDDTEAERQPPRNQHRWLSLIAPGRTEGLA